MDLSSLSSFLSSSKRNLTSVGVGKALGDIHVVLCNESSDLDSVVSSIVTGYYIAHSICKEEKENNEEPHSFVFSVINCSREDLPLRTEAIFWLKENGLDPDQLICRDEIDLNGFHGSGALKLTLVDHNVLAHGDTHFASSIHRVIDHHKRDRAVDRRDTIETVGSCCTLVAEMVLGLFASDPIVCRLLYGTIVLDTFNFSAAAQRTTGKDLKVVQELEDAISASRPRPNNSEIFKALTQARADVSQLTPDQLLRKDSKLVRLPEIVISIPAVPILSQQLLELPNMMESLKSHTHSQSCGVIIILCYRVGELNGEIKKDIIIYSDSIQKARQICTLLENSELELRLIRSSIDNQSALFAYQQGNVSLSRKYVLPFLVKRFDGRTSNNQISLDTDTLSGGELLIHGSGDAGAASPNKFVASPLPSISYTAVQSLGLGLGDPISQSGSSQNSAYNSCPYTPQNSCSEPVDGLSRENYFLPSFNSREMIEKIELKRGKLRGYEKGDDELKPNPSYYPFTPKNSYVESNLEAVFEQSHPQIRNMARDQQGGGVLHAIDSDLLLRKLMEKQRQPGTGNVSYYSSSNSSKSQSLTKLNVDEFVAGGDPLGSPNQSQTPPVTGAMDIPQLKRHN